MRQIGEVAGLVGQSLRTVRHDEEAPRLPGLEVL